MKAAIKQSNALVILCIIICAAIFPVTGCSQKKQETSIDFSAIQSFRDIPGVTAEEITAIKSLQREYESFVYGMIPSTEVFKKSNGEVGGYAALFCEWLTGLFDIPFKLDIFSSHDLIEKLNSGDIDFSGNIMPTPERERMYYMTDTIAERQFITIRLANTLPLDQILHERPLRYAFMANTPVEAAVASVTESGTYEPVRVNNFSEAYQILVNGEADALISTSVAVVNFIDYNDIVFEDFIPLIFNPVSMATAKKALEPIISVVNKALRNGAIYHLYYLYNQGYQDYFHYKMSSWLTDEECAFIDSGSAVPVAAFSNNYPLSFYNEHENEWQGIYFDLLDEISSLTGLSFEVVHDKTETWPVIYQMLINGEAHIVPELIKTKERENLFIWSDVVIMDDHYALVSRTDYRNISINEILQLRVGLVLNSVHADIFKQWFPDNRNTVEYEDIDLAFRALLNGKVNMVMTTQRRLMQLTHYQEQTAYKSNVIFNQIIETRFGFNKDETVLRSIVDKALKLIDINGITVHWTEKFYDYRVKDAESRFLYLIGAILISLILLVFIFFIFVRNRIKLQKEIERIRIMLDTIPVACFIGSGKSIVVDCNNEAVRLFELKDKQEFIKRFDKDLSPKYQPDGQLSCEAIFKYGYQAEREGRCDFNWMHQLPNGSPLPAIITLESVTYGKEKFLMAYIRDMREYTKMTAEIERQNESLKAINIVSSALLDPGIEQFKDSLLNSMDTLGNLLDVDRVSINQNIEINGRKYSTMNYRWSREKNQEETYKYQADLSYDDVLHGWWETLSAGKCINSLVHNMSAAEQAELNSRKILSIFVTPVFVHDEFWGYVAYVDCRKERKFSVNEEIIMRSAGKMFTSAFIRNDMTNSIIETTFELMKAKESADLSNRSKSMFLSQMSHEIRTPMNAILGIAEIHLRDKTLQQGAHEAFGKIYESGDLLLNIINDILDLSKIESGKLELILCKYDIPSLINDTAQLNRLRYDSKPIDLLIHVDENTPIDLFGDELRIKQILNNILSNAFKYTDEGKIEFSVSAESGEADNITLILQVSDTGQGMTESQLEKLFDEYARFNLEVNRTIVGAGLGMNITKRLLDLMSGNIEVESEPGKGSVFTVRIPQKRTSPAVCGKEIAEKLRSFRFNSTTIMKKTQFIQESMPYGSILVVDDVESNIYVIKGMLAPYGLKIETASSGPEAIMKIKDGNVYDIIFMDHMMPKMDGIEATKIMRDMGYTNSIVALTANALVGRAEMFMQNGFDGFISKPIDTRELNRILNELIRNKQPQEVIDAARQKSQPEGVSQPAINEGLAAATANDIENALAVLDEFIPAMNNDEQTAATKLFTTTVHGMKSALANIGETALSDIALRLEQAANNGETSVISTETPEFINALRLLLEKIKPPIKGETGENVNISQDDIHFLRNKLTDIKTACENLVLKDAKKALAELKHKTWPRKINDIINEISLCLLRGEFAKVVSAVDAATDTLEGK